VAVVIIAVVLVFVDVVISMTPCLAHCFFQAIALVEQEEANQSRLNALKRVAVALELLLIAYIARRSFLSLRTHIRTAFGGAAKA
jgi:hypothetical protein